MLKPLASSTRFVVDLSGVFSARIGDGPSGDILLGRGYNRVLAVPGAWNHQAPELQGYTGRVWYCREFCLPAEARGRRILLRCDAVNWGAQVFVNGRRAGGRSGGFLPFEVDLTPHVQFAEPNVLVIGVEMEDGSGTGGGIIQPLRLLFLPEDGITDLHYDVELKGADAVLAYEIEHTGGRVKVEVAGRVAEGAVGFVRVPSARLWSPEEPFLYPFVARLYGKDGTLLDEYRDCVGLRAVGVGEAGLCLNGKPVYLRAARLHADLAGAESGGNTQSACLRDLSLMRLVGLNCCWPVGYPPSWALAELCDRAGMLLAVEVPVSNLSGAGVQSKRFIEEAICALRNHASVVLWSLACGSESVGGRFWQNLRCHAKNIDPFRPVVCLGGEGLSPKARDASDMTMLSLQDVPRDFDADIGTRLYETIEETHLRFGRPVLVDGFEGSLGNGSHLSGYLDALEANEHSCGFVLSALADSPSVQDDGRVVFSDDGLFARDRQPKPVAWSLHRRFNTARTDGKSLLRMGART